MGSRQKLRPSRTLACQRQQRNGDLLVIGKRHYGDKIYEEAEKILGLDYQTLARLKRISELFEISRRRLNLSWSHHFEVASIKQTEIVYPDKTVVTLCNSYTDHYQEPMLAQEAKAVLYAEVKLGELLKEIPPKPIADGSGKGTFGGREQSLPEGINKRQSHVTQQIKNYR